MQYEEYVRREKRTFRALRSVGGGFGREWSPTIVSSIIERITINKTQRKWEMGKENEWTKEREFGIRYDTSYNPIIDLWVLQQTNKQTNKSAGLPSSFTSCACKSSSARP